MMKSFSDFLDEGRQQIGHLTKNPSVTIHLEKTKSRLGGSKTDVMMRAPGVRPTPLYRGVPADWDHEKVASHLETRDADRFKKAGGVTWAHRVKESLEEGKNYHSVFFKSKEPGSKWNHHFDADDKEDARIEKEGIRNSGDHAHSMVVPKDKANWHKMSHDDMHDMVQAHYDKSHPKRGSDVYAGIHELSKSTLGSYVKKASNSLQSRAHAAGFTQRDPKTRDYGNKQLKTANNRSTGIKRATDRLVKEAVASEKVHDHVLSKHDFSPSRHKGEGGIYYPAEHTDHRAALHAIHSHLTTHGFEHSYDDMPHLASLKAGHHSHDFDRGAERVSVVMRGPRITHVEHVPEHNYDPKARKGVNEVYKSSATLQHKLDSHARNMQGFDKLSKTFAGTKQGERYSRMANRYEKAAKLANTGLWRKAGKGDPKYPEGSVRK
jgi:hypothetical protein